MTGEVVLTGIREAALSVDEVVAAVTRPGTGGTAVFVGTVRDNDADPGGARGVTSLEYSAHPDAERVMATVAAEVAAGPRGDQRGDQQGDQRGDQQGDQHVRLAVLHRTGSLAVGDTAIVVAAAAAHRGEAFAACRQLVDEVKARVPIWKREHFADGAVSWVGMPAGAGPAAGVGPP